MNMQVTNWAEHYKAVSRRIANAPVKRTAGWAAVKPAPKPAPKAKRASATLYDEPIGPVRVRDILNIASDRISPPHSEIILREICAEHDVSRNELMSRRRRAEVLAARLHAYYRLHKETSLSLPQIGRIMGGRDHTTILVGVRAYEAKLTGIAHPSLVKNRERARERHRAIYARRGEAVASGAEA